MNSYFGKFDNSDFKEGSDGHVGMKRNTKRAAKWVI